MIHLRGQLRKLPDSARIGSTFFISLSFLSGQKRKLIENSTTDLDFFHPHTASLNQPKSNKAPYSVWTEENPAPPTLVSTSSYAKSHLLDSRAVNDQAALLSRHSRWRQIIADLVVQYSPYPRPRLSVCLLPGHPLIAIILNLLHTGHSSRASVLLDRISQGAGPRTKSLSSLYLSPAALEILVDAAVETKAANMLPSLTHELARTQSTSKPIQSRHSVLSLRLSIVYEKLMNAHFMVDDPGSALGVYSAAIRAAVPCSAFVFKRAIQSLFKRLIPTPDSDLRRISQPRRANVETGFHTPHSSTTPPVDAILAQVNAVLDRVSAENIPLSSRMLADIFRGLGSVLKLETQGTEPEQQTISSHDPFGGGDQQGGSLWVSKNLSPRFRLDRLVLDQEAWSSIGGIITNIFTRTTTSSLQQDGGDGQLFLLMAWADVMLSLREDIADAATRTTISRSTLRELSRRVDDLIGRDEAWSYQKTFDRLAKSSYLRPHHVNSYGSVGSEVDPALDLPAGPAPGQWPVSRTLAEAQRISLLVRDRLVEGDSLAALLQFHSLASLCGTFRRLCDVHDPDDAPSLLVQTPGGGMYQRPPETVLAEARQELDVRVESVYVRLAGHALRTGDSGYVNDVLELAYTLPPRPNKLTFSRVWKRAMGAFVSWRSEWHGSGGIGRAFKTLAHLLGVGPDSVKGQALTTNAIDRAWPRAIVTTNLNHGLFDLAWLREQHTWPALGRNVFSRAHIVSALINKAEDGTPPYLQPGAKPDRTMGPKHLRDAQRAIEEAERRRAIRWLRENHPHYIARSNDPTPSLAELDAEARAEARIFRVCDWDGDSGQAGGSGESERAARVGDYSAGVPATAILVSVFGALSVPVSTNEAQRLGYTGPTYVKRLDKGPTLRPAVKA